MIVEDQENLHKWLLVVLEPLCDADPDALAKYIFALLKKDLSVPELKKRVCKQLEVFLSEKTDYFVDKLFTVIETKNYDTLVVSQTSVRNSVDNVNSMSYSAASGSSAAIKLPEQTRFDVSKPTFDCEVSSTSRDISVVKPVTSNYEVSTGNKSPVLCKLENLNGENGLSTLSAMTIPSTSASVCETDLQNKELSERITSPNSKSVQLQSKSCSAHNDAYFRGNKSLSPRTARRSPTSSYSTFKSRTRSQSPYSHLRAHSRPRRRRSRSFDRNRRRVQTFSRSRKSPFFKYKNTVRHQSRSRSTAKRSNIGRSRSRSPFFNRKSYRNRSPQNSYRPRSRSWSSHSRSRSRSRSWSKTRPMRSRSRSPFCHLSRSTATPVQDSSHEDTDMRLNTTSQSIKSVVSVGIDKSVSPETITTDPASIMPASIPLPTSPASVTTTIKVENMPSDANSSIITSASSQFSAGVKQRCRDFDEMGYCMRGDMCPFDHGVDPVVLEDIGIVSTEILNFGVAAPITSEPNSEVSVKGLDISAPIKNSLNVISSVSNIPPTEEYNPDSPEIGSLPWPTQFTASGKQSTPHTSQSLIGTATMYTHSQRELISVPVVGEAKPNLKRENVCSVSSIEHSEDLLRTKRRFDFKRLGPPKYKNMDNCSLELKKIPHYLNNIFQLNNHFSKFGKIINIQVCYNQDPEAAVITFSSHVEANTAYRSTDAVLNNRFIKVFWHPSSDVTPSVVNNSKTQPAMRGNSSLARISVKDRLGVSPSVMTSVSNLKSSDREKVPAASVPPYFQSTYIPTSISRLKTEVSSSSTSTFSSSTLSSSRFLSNIPSSSKSFSMKQSNVSLLNSAKELKMKNVIQISSDLRKRQQQLLEKLLEQQKSLVRKLENKEYTSPENKTEILAAIKKLQENIDEIRQELRTPFPLTKKNKFQTPPQSQSQSNVNIKKAKQDIQREILDAELDLLMKQKDGVDITDLKKKLENLKTRLGPWKM